MKNVSSPLKNKYASAVESAILKSRKSDTGYGKTAERLAESGLSGSGYSSYISNIGNKELRASLDESFENALKKESAYQRDVEEDNAEIIKIRRDVINYAKRNSLTDYTAVYEYALSSGLSGKNLENAVNQGIYAAQEKIRSDNIQKTKNLIVSKNLTRQQTYSYALSLGLSAKDARELAELAYSMNQSMDGIKGDSAGDEPPSLKNGSPFFDKASKK